MAVREKKDAVTLAADAGMEAGGLLGTNDKWPTKFFDLNDLHAVDRELFGG